MTTSCIILVNVQNGLITETTKRLPDRLNSFLHSHRFDAVIAAKLLCDKNHPYGAIRKVTKTFTETPAKLKEYVTHTVTSKSLLGEYEGLEDLLKELQPSILYIAGIGSEVTILTLSIRLYERGFKGVKVLQNFSISPYMPDAHDFAMEAISLAIGGERVSDEIYIPDLRIQLGLF